jgi:hypothetical protein
MIATLKSSQKVNFWGKGKQEKQGSIQIIQQRYKSDNIGFKRTNNNIKFPNTVCM